MSDHHTRGSAGLRAFLQRHKLSQVAAASELGTSGPTVHEWCSGSKRPRPHYREAIEIWTGGEVKAGDWDTGDERQCVDAVRPHIAPVQARRKALARTG